MKNYNMKKFNEFKASEFKDDIGEWSIKKWNLEDAKLIDLNEDVKLSVDTQYQFLGVFFTVRYNPTINAYFCILSYPHPITGDIPNDVIYSDNLKDMKEKIRKSITEYKKEYDLL